MGSDNAAWRARRQLAQPPPKPSLTRRRRVGVSTLPILPGGRGSARTCRLLLTDPRGRPLFVAGFTLTGGADPFDGVRIYLRVENGSWSPWYLSRRQLTLVMTRATPGTGRSPAGPTRFRPPSPAAPLPAGPSFQPWVPPRLQGEEVPVQTTSPLRLHPTPPSSRMPAMENQGTSRWIRLP